MMTLDRRTTGSLATPLPRVVRALTAAFLVLAIAGAPAAAGNPKDGSFGRNGIARVDFGGADKAVSGFLLPSGKYLVVGQSKAAGGTVRIALARVGSDGDLDPSFGDDGRALVAPLDIGGVEAGARTPDGRVVVLVHDTKDRHALVGLDRDGSVDRSFGDDGVVRTDSRSYGWGSILALPNGDVLVATDDLVRYTAAGRLDRSFGRDGSADLGSIGAGLMREKDGDILVFGPGGASVHGRRYDAQGHRDRSFGRAIDSNAFVSVYPRYFLTGLPMVGAISARGRIFLGSLAGQRPATRRARWTGRGIHAEGQAGPRVPSGRLAHGGLRRLRMVQRHPRPARWARAAGGDEKPTP